MSYLRSPEWAALRARALQVNGGFCSFCTERAVEVHHIKYPKEFKDDSIFNVQAVCRRHHEVMHGMGNVALLPRESTEVVKFQDQPFVLCKGDEKFLGTTFEHYCSVFCIPSVRITYFREQFDFHARELADDNSKLGIYFPLIYKSRPDGEEIFSWKVAVRSADALYRYLKERCASDNSVLKHEALELQACWEGIHRMKLQIDEWVEAVLRAASSPVENWTPLDLPLSLPNFYLLRRQCDQFPSKQKRSR